MSVIYRYNVNNTTDIATKITQLSDRVPVNFEITVELTSVTFDSGDDDVVFDFVASLTDFQLSTLAKLVKIIVEEIPVSHVYPFNRTIVSPRFPVSDSDNLNGYNVGDVLVNITSNKPYICYDNSTNAAIWLHTSGQIGLTNGFIGFQNSETSLSDADATLTMSQLLSQVLTIGPTANRTLTLPTAVDAVAGLAGVRVNDAIDFTIIHTTTSATDPFITINMGTGGTSIGFMEVHPRVNDAGTYFSSGSAVFRMRFTNITSSSEAYTVYRIS